MVVRAIDDNYNASDAEAPLPKRLMVKTDEESEGMWVKEGEREYEGRMGIGARFKVGG